MGCPLFVALKQEPPQPENGKDSKNAGHCRRQVGSHKGSAKERGGKRNRVDNHPFASAMPCKENSVLSLQHAQRIHAVRSFVLIDAGREFVYPVEAQQRNRQCQRDHNPRSDRHKGPSLDRL